jgi:hypothetical protein
MKYKIALIVGFAVSLACSQAHADGVIRLRDLPDDKEAVRNGAILLFRMDVGIQNATEEQTKMPIEIALYPVGKRNVDLVLPNGKLFNADGMWTSLEPGKNIVAISPPPGEYYWRSMNLRDVRVTHVVPIVKDRIIIVKDKTINYIGDFHIVVDLSTKKATTEVVDGFDATLAEFTGKRPSLSTLYPSEKAILSLSPK